MLRKGDEGAEGKSCHRISPEPLPQSLVPDGVEVAVSLQPYAAPMTLSGAVGDLSSGKSPFYRLLRSLPPPLVSIIHLIDNHHSLF